MCVFQCLQLVRCRLTGSRVSTSDLLRLLVGLDLFLDSFQFDGLVPDPDASTGSLCLEPGFLTLEILVLRGKTIQ